MADDMTNFMKMNCKAFLLLGILTIVKCQELVVTHAPEYVSFHQQDSKLSTSEVPDIIASTLGLNTQSENKWQGIKQNSIFKKPKANVLITLLTEDEEKTPFRLNSLARFPLENDFFGLNMESVMNKLQQTFFDQDPLMLDMIKDSNLFNLQSDNSVFQKLPTTIRKIKDRLLDSDSILQKLDQRSLNMTSNSDSILLGELQMVDDIIKTLSQNDQSTTSKSPDLLSFTISGIRNVADKHGIGSDKLQDAKNMVSDFIHHTTNELKNLYNGNVIVEVVTVKPVKGLVRKARSLLASTTPAPPEKKNLNLASDYDENFPAIFNIVLWMMVLLAIAVYVIVYGMWFMDPGRDSIIYRMTSQRLKKD